MQSEVINDPSAASSEHPFAMGVIHHHHGFKAVGDVDNVVQRCDVAIHREDAIGDYEDLSDVLSASLG